MIPDPYEINPSMPSALQFPRLPPGVLHPLSGMAGHKERLAAKQRRVTPNLGDYIETHRKLVAGLIDLNPGVIIPPTHPLFTSQHSVDALRAENAMLKKENIDLRKKLDSHAPKPSST